MSKSDCSVAPSLWVYEDDEEGACVMNGTYEPGGDARAISRISKEHFGGSYKTMFEAHGWVLEDGQQYMHQASSRIKDHYGSVAAFEAHFDSGGSA